MSTSTGKLKLRLRIFNVILIAISTLSICWLAIMPFISVKVNYKLTEETVKEVMKDMNEEEVDIKDIVGDGINLGITLEITPKMLIKSLTVSDTKQYVRDDVIAPTVDSIIEEVKPVIEEIAKRAVKSQAKKELKDYLQDSFKEAFNDENVDVLAKLAEANIDVDASLDKVFTAFTANDAKFDDVVDTLIGEINDIGDKAYKYYPELTGDWTQVDPNSQEITDMKDDIKKALKEVGLVDDQDKILDFDTMLGILLDKAMGEDNKTTEDNNSIIPASVLDPLNRVDAEEADEETEAESLSDKVKKLIYDKLPSGIESTIAMVMKITAGVLGFFLLTWAFVGVFALLKTIFGRNPGIFTGLICFLSGLLQVILGIVVVYGVTLLQSGKINIDVVHNLVSNIPNGLSVALLSSTTIPAFCLLAKFILTFFYHPTKRRLKKRLDME